MTTTLKPLSTLIAVAFAVVHPRPLAAQIGEATPVLESFGATLGVMVYNTYLSIGALADGHGCDAYDTPTIQALMDEQVGMIDRVLESLDKARRPEALEDSEDRAFVDQAILALRDLRTVATKLKLYVESDSEIVLRDYNDARASAWTRIEELLGLGETEGQEAEESEGEE